MRKLQPSEVWLRALEATVGATLPTDSWGGVLGRTQLQHAFDRADETVEAFRERFCDEDEE